MASRSKRPPPFSATRWLQSLMTPIILLANRARSSSGTRSRVDCFWYPLRNATKPFGSSAPGGRTHKSVRNMKKRASKSSTVSANRLSASRKRRPAVDATDDLRPHYDFDYSKARPNRFASRVSKETVAVVLDPDVATVFHSSEAVNSFLRSAISAMPPSEPRKR